MDNGSKAFIEVLSLKDTIMILNIITAVSAVIAVGEAIIPWLWLRIALPMVFIVGTYVISRYCLEKYYNEIIIVVNPNECINRRIFYGSLPDNCVKKIGAESDIKFGDF